MNNYHTQSPHYAAKMLLSDLDSGLSEKEAERRRANDGQNKIDGQKRKSVFRLFFEQLNDFMVLILLTAAGVSLLLSAADGGGSITDSLIILAVVCINAIVGTAWELKAQKSLDALKRLSAPHANVIRSGKPREIAAAELVKGDIITLTCGDIVPADCRITESRELYTDEASLTGKSVNSEKMKIKLIIVSTDNARCENRKYKYFISSGHIDYWRYSPYKCTKTVETVF